MGLGTFRKRLSKFKISNYLENKRISKAYDGALNRFRSHHITSDKVHAVVVHIYYTDNWLLFKLKLHYLQSVHHFDLFITIPEQNIDFMEEVRKDFPTAEYLVCPNRGRDVLPFLMITKILAEWKYETVLKFHSKKSTHWDGGQSWLEKTLDQIVPENEAVLHEIVKAISKNQTGVVGPSEFYYPLTVNFPANGVHMSQFVIRNYGKKAERHYLQTHRAEYGFFGGSMLWMRIDAVQKLLSAAPNDFEPETGQIDGTYAHSVERLLSVVPQIENRINYQCDGDRVTVREHLSDNIPDWSEDHDN